MNEAVWGAAGGVAAAALAAAVLPGPEAAAVTGARGGEVWPVQDRFIAHGTPG